MGPGTMKREGTGYYEAEVTDRCNKLKDLNIMSHERLGLPKVARIDSVRRNTIGKAFANSMMYNMRKKLYANLPHFSEFLPHFAPNTTRNLDLGMG